MYRLHFTWKEKPRIIYAKSLDMTHPYFVSIKGLVFPDTSKVIINPNDDDLRREFGMSEHLMIPFQSVQLIEEVPDTQDLPGARVIQFAPPESTTNE